MDLGPNKPGLVLWTLKVSFWVLYCTCTVPKNHGRVVRGSGPVVEADGAVEEVALCVPRLGLHPEPAGDPILFVHSQGDVVAGHALSDRLVVHSPGHSDVVRVEV